MSPRLFFAVASTEARKRLAYRADFWIQALVAFAAEAGLAWFVWEAVFREAGRDVVGGFTRGSAFLYYVAVILVGKCVRTPQFSGNVVSQDVYEGTLSKYLLYPAPYLGMKYAEHLGSLLPSLVQVFLFGAAFPFLVAAPDVHVTVGSVATGLGTAAVANLCWFSMAAPIQGVAFWADNVWSLAVAQRLVCDLLGGALIPLSVFPAWAQEALRWTPFPHLLGEPALQVLGRRGLAEAATSVGVLLAWTLVLAGLTAFVFRRGRLRYTGVGI